MRIALAALLACATGARADNLVTDPGAPFYGNVEMPRAAAMGGAHAAIATANDALVVNPAGIATGHKYHFEIDGLYDARFPAQAVTLSIVDTASSPVGSGLLFSRWASGSPAGRAEGWLGGLAYAGAVGQDLYYGGQTKYIRFHGPDGLSSHWAQDVGILSRKGGFSWAAVVQNIALEKIPLFPLTGTVAVALGSDSDWHLAFDYKADLSDLKGIKHRAAFGGELLLEQSIALRAGGTFDATARLWWASAGVAFLTEKGGLQVAWRRRLTGPFDQLFEAGLTVYLQ